MRTLHTNYLSNELSVIAAMSELISSNKNDSSFTQLINRLILENHYDGIPLLFQDNQNILRLQESYCGDIVQICIKHLTETNHERNLELYLCCEKLLKLIAEFGGPEDVLFELLDMLEGSTTDNLFTSVLKAMQIALVRQPENGSRPHDWALTAIRNYVWKLKYPEVLHGEYNEKEQHLLEEDPDINRILTIYITVFLFFEKVSDNLIANLSAENENLKTIAIARKSIMMNFLLQLLDEPLALLDLTNDGKHTNTYTLQCAKSLLKYLSKILKDPFSLLEYVENRTRFKRRNIEEESLGDVSLCDDKTSVLSYAILFYLLIAEDLLHDTAPKVYKTTYIFEMCLYLVNTLIDSETGSLQHKGIKLGSKLLENLGSKKIKSSFLELNVNSDFCDSLIKIVIYSKTECNRLSGIVLLKKYITQFTCEGQFFILKNLLKSTTHNGLLGFLMIMYKDLVAEKLNTEENLDSFLCGSNFREIIMKYICNLSNSVETDIMEASEQIMSALNIIRFFAIRDKTNKTGFWDFVKNIEEEFLNRLRTALDLSRAHYKEEESRVKFNKDRNINDTLEVNLVDNEDLPEISNEQKLVMLKNAMLKFDLIESLMARANECLSCGNTFSVNGQFYGSGNFLSRSPCKNVRVLTNVSFSTQTSSQDKRSNINKNDQILLKNIKYQINSYSTNGGGPGKNDKTSPIDEFRAKQEKLEEEFSKQQKPPPEENINNEKQELIKNQILDASLPFVSTYGWTRKSISQGAETIGYPSVVHGMFPNGGIELVHHFCNKCNEKLAAQMKEETKNGEILPTDPVDFIYRYVKLRLQMIEPFISYWPQGLAMMSLPQNASTSLAQLLTLIDDICYYSGDRATDFGWYSRRIGLATIYKMTEMYILQDSSIDHQETWGFFKKRMEEAALLQSFLFSTEDQSKQLPARLSSAFVTARNILGLDFTRR